MKVALKDGHYVKASQFEPGTGLDCNCICPECGERVGSRIFLKKDREDCFFHENKETKCEGGQGETELHLIAKEIFKSNNHLMLPSPKNKEKFRFDYVDVIVEKKISKIRPDIILINSDDENLIIEIAVTSFINEIKLQKIEELKIPTIEINLKNFYKEEKKEEGSIDEEILQILLIEDITTKNWIGKSNNHFLSLKSKEVEKESSNWKEILGGIGLFILIFQGLNWLFSSKKRKK